MPLTLMICLQEIFVAVLDMAQLLKLANHLQDNLLLNGKQFD